MATRRTGASEKVLIEDQNAPAASVRTSDTSPAVPASVIYKLLGFTLAMVVVPIGSYFVTLNVVFGGKAAYAGGFAAFMANVVLMAYIFAAVMEDKSETLEEEERRKKGQ